MVRILIRVVFLWLICVISAWAEVISEEEMAARIFAPMSMGERLTDDWIFELLNSGGAHAGYVFQTEPMAALPGFSGAPINMLVVLDLEGRFVDVQLLTHNEPMAVGTPYGGATDGSRLTYLDGVTKATASVRIAHESILAATLKVAREKMGGVSAAQPAFPDPDVIEDLSFADLKEQGLITHKRLRNRELGTFFAGTIWADDDPEAQAAPDEAFLDLWVCCLMTLPQLHHLKEQARLIRITVVDKKGNLRSL